MRAMTLHAVVAHKLDNENKYFWNNKVFVIFIFQGTQKYIVSARNKCDNVIEGKILFYLFRC